MKLFSPENVVTISNPCPGICEAVNAAGIYIENNNGTYYASDAQAAQAIIDAHDPLPGVIATKLSALADFRWQKEIGGIVFNNLKIETTDRSKTLVTGAMLMASQNTAATFQFKTTDDKYVDVNAQDMLGIYAAIGTHVQSCFAKEQDIANTIKALTKWEDVVEFNIEAAWNA